MANGDLKFSLRCAACECAIREPVQSRKPGENRVPCAQRSGARGLGKNGEVRPKNSAGARNGSRNPASRKRLFGVVPEKDSNPADIFRTLSFEVDRQGDEFVQESKDPSNMILFRNPYVAKVFSGRRTVRENYDQHEGAFFYPIAGVVEVGRKAGLCTIVVRA